MCGDFAYQAASRDKPWRVVARVERHPGDLFPKIGFVVTNPPMEPDRIIRFYNQRGTAEQHVEEGRKAVNRTRLSCKGMARNEVRLQLHASACNPGVFLQGIDLPEETADRSPTGLRTCLIRIGARVVRHARAITFQPAEAAVGGALFTRILAAIQRLRAPPVPASGTCMTVSTIKPGGKRLDGSDPTGAGQTDFRFKPVAAAINRARFTNRMPEPRHSLPKGIDPYANSGGMIEMAF